MPTKAVAAATAVAVIVVLAASGSAVAAHHNHLASHRLGTIVKLHKSKLGKILTTGKDFTLYRYKPDPKGKSLCKKSCASIWPPLLTKGKPRAGKGVRQRLLGTIKRGRKRQVTYSGHPLYRYSGDARGQTNGEAYGGIWYAVNAAGKEVKPKQSGGTTTGGGGGYGSGY